jgi:triacylglycerol lipase
MTRRMIVPKLRAPILLVHGLMGFNEVKLGPWTIARYFPGIPELLRQAGNRVLAPRVSATGGVAVRAAQLKAFLDREAPGEAVHILAHSMGGLDSRYLISRLRMAERVLSLTTIATPHRGTAFADWGLRRLGRLMRPLFDLFDLPFQAFEDVTTARCREFNAQVPDAPGVRYFAVAGRHEGDWIAPEWQLPFQIVSQAEGPNDGVVSVASASYGESTEVWEGDHLSLINWPDRRARWRGRRLDRTADFARLIRRLADEGF